MSKQDLSFSVSSHIVHPDLPELTDIHTWDIFLAEYSPNHFTVFNYYRLSTVGQAESGERKAFPMLTNKPFAQTYDTLEEATYQFNVLTLQAFTALRGQAATAIKEVEDYKLCQISLLPND